MLDAIHDDMLARVRSFRDENTHDGANLGDVEAFFKDGKTGFIRVPVSVLEDAGLEVVKKEYSLTARNMPFDDDGQKVIFAKAY